MKLLFSVFLLFSLISFCFSDNNSSNGSSFDLNGFYNQLASAHNKSKELFRLNRSNLNSISSAENQHTLETNELVLQSLQNNIQKNQQQQELYKTQSQSAAANQDQTSKDLIDYLNQEPHVLFDDSSSDDSQADQDDQPSPDEQNEILLAQLCTKAFVNSIPPSFCIKSPLDLGTFDVQCANGDEEILGLCYAACPSGYQADGIVCGTPCPNGYTTESLTCYKNLFNWKFRSIRTRSTYTFYDSRAYCQEPKVKEILLVLPKCYYDCTEIDLLNCGTNTCGMTQQVCTDSIKNIIKDLLIGIGKLFLDVVTFGLSGLITSILANPNAMYNAAKAAGQAAMQAAYADVQVWMNRIDQNKLIQEMVALTNTYVAQNATLAAAVTEDRITNRCSSVRDIFYQQFVTTNTVNLQWQDFSSNDLRDYVNMCAQANAGDACKQAIRQSVLKWDPTGIVSMVSAFQQTNCPTIH